MVSVSMETTEQTERRLRAVLAAADFTVEDGVWTFRESPLDDPPVLRPDELLAVVRDEQTWSWLTPVRDVPEGAEQFGVFSFHFPPGLDNSGFVGWLATTLKARLGTGVFVICGNNSHRGGIYDYWGCPIGMLDRAVDLVEQLRTDDE